MIFCRNSKIAEFKWHKKAITSIEWHPTDSSIIVASGEDDQTTIWDFSAEADIDEEHSNNHANENISSIPSQLMFIHQVSGFSLFCQTKYN